MALKFNPLLKIGLDDTGSGGGGGVSALSAIGSSPNADGATITGSTLNLEPASDSFGGVVTTGTQTFAGAKTITDVLTHLQTASAGNTVVYGLSLTNETTASSGNQMYSGALHWKGYGWRTGAGGVSTPCEFRSYILPVQSSTAAECTLVFEANQNSVGYSSVMQLRMNSSAPQALFEFGTAALPSISFRVDPDTGIRRSAANQLALVAGGAESFYVDINGAYAGTAGINSTQFASHPSTTTKHGAVWRSRNSISVDYFNFQNDSATQEASLFRSSGTSGDWKWRMTGGTAALPSYSFYSQTTIGMYAAGTNILGFSVAGVETFRISQGLQRTSYDASNYLNITVGSTGGVTLDAVGSGARFTFKDKVDIDRQVQVKIFDDSTALSTGDGKLIFCVPIEYNGYNLVAVAAFVTTVSSSGAPTVMVRNVTQAADMLSTAITIDASEYTSYTAATPPVIDTANDDVATGDLIAIDVDGAGTGAKGLGVLLSFQIP